MGRTKSIAWNNFYEIEKTRDLAAEFNELTNLREEIPVEYRQYTSNSNEKYLSTGISPSLC